MKHTAVLVTNTYSNALNSWTRMNGVGAPSPRSFHEAIQAGDEMITWGGVDGAGTILNTGARYCASCPDISGFEAGKDLSFANSSTLIWTGNAGVTSYGLYRGTLGVGPPGYNHTCLLSGLGSPTASDVSVPPAGTGFYYLVDAANGCSRTGLGRNSGGGLRPNFPWCPRSGSRARARPVDSHEAPAPCLQVPTGTGSAERLLHRTGR